MSWALSALLLALGCQTRNAEKCEQGLSVTRKAVTSGDFALARQWREFAYKMCDAAGQDKEGLAKLDLELSTAEANVQAKAAAEAQRKAKNEALLKLFISWASDNRGAPEKASVAPVCDAQSADAAEAARVAVSKEQLCTATRMAGESALSARYWQADPKLVRFSTKFPQPVTCADFGATESKSFDVAASDGSKVKRSRCEIGSGALSGMSVVVSAANSAEAYIFAPGYLDKDAMMKQIAGG